MILTMEIARNLKSVSQKLYYAVGAFSDVKSVRCWNPGKIRIFQTPIAVITSDIVPTVTLNFGKAG